MRPLQVEQGCRFGFLTVVSETEPTKDGKRRFYCRCDCGNDTTVRLANLSSGNTSSCGCYQQIAIKQTLTIHGMSYTAIHKAWDSMKYRCNNPNATGYKNYGGRGIAVCQEWSKSFTSFMQWALANGYFDGAVIDRVDNNGDYCPENCRWTTRTVNNRNRRNSRRICAFGEVKTIGEWVEDSRCQCSYDNLEQRLRVYKWNAERAITEPTRKVPGIRIKPAPKQEAKP